MKNEKHEATLKTEKHPHRGLLMAIGGAEDKVGSRAILSEFVKNSGGNRAVIAIFPTASSIPKEIATLYSDIFKNLGAEVRIVDIQSRAEAEEKSTLLKLENVTGIFFTGGAQGKIVTLMGGTQLAQNIRRAFRSGVTVAGTSAGASVVCEHMIALGKKGYAPRRQSVTIAPGLGLNKRLIIDQHFTQRHRIGRLFAAVAYNPYLIGVGIDEDTAITVDMNNQLEVIGRGTVTVVDGGKIAFTNIHEVPDKSPATLLGLQVHILTKGCSFDIDHRKPGWPLNAKEQKS